MALLQPGASGTSPAAAGLAAASRQTRAFEAELPLLRQRLLRQARLTVGDPGMAEDLVQETLVAVVEQHDQRRGDASLLTWSVGILKHKVADWYRSPARQRTVQLGADDLALGQAIDSLYDARGEYIERIPAWQEPESDLERREMMAILERCMAGLPRQTGRVFMMREWLGFETGEICQRLGVSTENCRTLLHRARMALRDCMQRSWLGAGARA